MNAVWKRAYAVLLTVSFYALPALMLLAINIRIYLVLRRSSHSFCDVDRKNVTARRHQQVSNNIACVVLIFLLCHMPLRVTALWFTFAPVSDIRRLSLNQMLLIIYMSRCCFYLNHAINPVLYNFVSSKFQEEICSLAWSLKQTMCCVLQRRKMSHSSYTSSHVTGKTAVVKNNSS